MTTTNAATSTATAAPVAPVLAPAASKRKALSGALGKLAVEVTGVSRDATPKHLEQLRTGTTELRGKTHTLTLIETARLVLKVVKKVGAEGIPSEVHARFPWGAMKRETLTEVAEAAGVEPSLFLAALDIESEEVSAVG